MPIRDKVYEKLRSLGLKDSKDDFYQYYDNDEKVRKDVYNRLREDGLTDSEEDFYNYMAPVSDEPYTHVYDEQGKLVGGTAYEAPEPYQYKPEVQQHIVENIPSMFKRNDASLMDKPLGDSALLPDLSDDKFQARIDVAQKNLQDPEVQKARTDAHLRGLSVSVDTDLNDIEDRIVQRKKSVRNENWKPGMPSSREDKALAELRGQRSYLEGAKDLIEESQKIVAAAKDEKDGTFVGGVLRGVRDKAFDVDNWTMGISDLVGGLRLKKVLEDYEAGKQLSPAQEKLLDAAITNMATSAWFESDLGRGYKAGQVTGESLPFMLEMMVNPISASGNAMAKSLLTAGLKRFGSVATNKAVKAGTRLATDALAATGMAATTGMPGVLGETVDRLNRNYEYGFDADGNLNVTKTGDTSFGEALGRSFTTRALENQSEMIFNAFRGAGELMRGIERYIPGGVNRFFDAVSNSKVGQLWREIKNSPLRKEIAQAAQIGGIGEEYLEEVYNNMANVALGEMSFEEAIDLDRNIDTFLGLAPTQVMFSMLGLGNMAAVRYQTRRDIDRLRNGMTEEQQSKLDELLSMGTINNGVDVRGFIRNVMADNSLTPEQKRISIEAAYDIAKQNAIDEIAEADISDNVESENQQIDAVTDSSTGIYSEVDRWVVDGETGVRVPQHGYIVGWIGEAPVFLPEGMENTEENRVVLKPNEWNPDTVERMEHNQVKVLNEEMIREEAAVQAELESKYSPEVLSAQMQQGVPFNTPTSQIIPVAPMPEGNGWIVEEYAMDTDNKVAKQPIVRELTNDEYRDMLQAQLDAEQAAAEQIVSEVPAAPVEEAAPGVVAEASEVVEEQSQVEAQQPQVEAQQAPVIPTKEDGSIDFVTYGKEGSFKTLGERYGEKMPNKVSVTAKAFAEDVAKAQTKLDKAQEAYDNAPIGREDRAKNAIDKAQQELDAIKREADFWAEMDAEIKSAQLRRSEILNPQAEIEASTEPMNVDEFVAQQLAAGNIVLNKDDYMRETGFGSEEANAMNGGTKKLFGKDGMTIQEAGERLMEMDRENRTNFFDQSDSNAGRDALISVLGSVKSRKELNQYISENRKAQAERDSEGLRNELEKSVMEANYSSLEDYVLQMEAAEVDIPFEGMDIAVKDAIFAEAEEEYQSYLKSLENGQGTTSEAAEGSDNVLSEEQSDDTGRTEERQGQVDGIGQRTFQEGENSHVGEQADEVELTRQEGETIVQFAERVAEESRRRPLRKRANEWSKALGVKVNLLESIDDVDARTRVQIEEAHAEGSSVPGWVAPNGEVFFFMPDLHNMDDVDNTYIHEVVAHIGLPKLLGEERFNEVCDKVWEMMPQSQKDFYEKNYPGVKGIKNDTLRHRRAADEYIAHLAEKENLTPEEKTIWDNIVKLFRDMLDKALNGIIGKSKITNEDISNLIKASYANLKSGAEDNVSGEGTRFNAKRTSDRRQEMNRVNNTVDQALSLVYGKDIKEIRKERHEEEQKRKEDAAEIYQSVLSGDFNDVTLQKINDYIDDATPLHPYGKRISQRLPQKLERGLHEGARTNAVDALFSRICESAVPASRRASEAGRREVEERKKEALKGWAIATNNWHTDLSDFADEADFIRQGTDSKVYLAKDGKHVIKVSFGKPEGKRFRPDIDTTALFNNVFRNTAYEIVGYGEFDGKFARILKQPFVDFADKTALNAEEREEYMRTLGFEPINESKTAFSNGSIVAADLQKSNILKDAAGNISVIDADMKLHTKDVGGNYTYPPVEADLPEGTRFRIVKDKNELVAVHNISEENLRKVLSVGGLIMPSIAITKFDMGHEGYGEISLLFDKETINPSDRRNKVYGGDAWTPRFPQTTAKINDKVSSKVYKKINGLIDNRALKDLYSLSAELHGDNIERTISDRGVEGYYNKEWMKLAYLLDNGKKVKVPMKMKDYGDMSETIIAMAKERGLKVSDIQQGSFDFYNNNKDFVESIKNIVDERKLSSLPEDKRDVARKLFGEKEMSFSYFDSLISAATRMEYDLEHGGLKQIIDKTALRESIEKKVKTNNADYNKWVDNLFDGIVEKYGIRNDRDWYTSSGNLRPWGQLYDDATPANILKHMLAENEQGGSGGFFDSNIMGASAETYDSIEEIREKGKKRLRKLEDGEYDEWSNSVAERMSEICNDFLSPSQRKEFGAAIDSKIAITNAAAKDKTAKGIYKEMKRDYPGFTMEHAKKVEEIVKEIQDFAIGYFEAKPRRIVPLNEVRKAIVPKNTSKDVLDGLKDNGIEVATYKKGDEAARARLIKKESDGLRFRRVYHGSGASFDRFDHGFMGTGEGSQAYGWGTYVSEVEGIARTYAGLKANNSPVASHTLRWLDENSTYEDFISKGEGARRKKTIEDAKEFLENLKEDGASEDIIDAYEQDLNDAERAITEDGYNQTKENMIASLNRHLYEVEIPDDNGLNYLSWNDEVQKEKQKELVNAIYDEILYIDLDGAYDEEIERLELKNDLWRATGRGGDLYGWAKSLGGDRAASEFFSEHGYVGIKVPTNNLRDGDKSHWNYVIFNENDLQIVNHTRFRISDKGRKIQNEVDKFTTKYNSKEVVLVDSEMTDNELEEAIPFSSAKRTREEITKGYMGGYSTYSDKIYIFVDNHSVDGMEDSMFHENLHPLFNDSEIVESFYDRAKDMETEVMEIVKVQYKESEYPNELFANIVAWDLNHGNFKHIEAYLTEEQQNELFDTLKEFGYDKGEESERRGRNGSSSEESDTSTGKEQEASEPMDGGLHERERSQGEQAERLRVLFGQVADMGLDGVLGNKAYTSAMVDIYKALPDDVRAIVAEDALRHYGGSVAPAVSDYLNHKEANVWDKVVGIIKDALRKVGFDVDLNANDVKYILWRSRKPLNRVNLLDVSEDIDMRYRLKVGEYFSSTDGGNIYEGDDNASVRFRVVSDKSLIEELESSEKRIGYRNVVLNADGSFGSPMADKLGKTGGNKKKTSGFEIGKWEQAEENPDLVDENGKIDLIKPDGKQVKKVDYNPYIHNRLNCVNRQFKQAWERPDLVYVETEIPLTDIESGYHAPKAKKPVGEHKWNGGNLILSRYDKPIRVVGWEEVANDWVKTFKKVGVHFDIVPPALLPILVKRGVKILPPHKGMGEDCNKAYQNYLNNTPTPDGGGTRFRVSGKLNIRDKYEATIKKGSYQAREAVQDNMLSLRRVQELIEKASGKKLRDFENAWMHENRLSSVVQSAIHEMERKYYKPMTEVVKKLMYSANLEQEQVADYLMLKHGIERNREMAVRKALTDSEGKIDRQKLEQWYQEKQAIRNDANLDTWRKKQEAMDNAALMFGADMSRDYSGLTSMFDTDDLADCTEKAYNEVEALENAHPAETEALRKAIKAMTQNTLDESFGSGLMNKAVYEELSNDMYDYYIPLRGFEETTSDEVYAYMDNDRGAFNAPLVRAKGRSSKSDNPLAYMKSIAESGIMQGERNKMKQTFLNMVINNPSDLVSVKEGVWAVYNPATGEWEAASFPESKVPRNATPADVDAAYQQWEADMEQRSQQDPNVKKVSEADDVPYRVIGNRMNQHQVIVKRLGKSYTLTINGNPRLAMALNGLTNPNNTSNDGKVSAFVQQKVDALNRTLSAWYTTRNPDFVASNFMRDTFYTNTIVRAKEGNGYANQFHKYYAKLLKPGKMISLFYKYENGTLDASKPVEKDFLDFMMNGGETGYSNLKDLEHIKKQISKELKGDRFAMFTKAAEKLDLLNRAVENTARFAAFRTSRRMGRTIAKSVFDAKEISVNFNKKGSGGTFFGATGQTTFGNLAAMVGAGGRAFYVFFNAAIQGTTNLMHVMKVNPMGTGAGIGAMFLMGAVIPCLFAGDDDEEKDYYDIPEHVRRNHLIIPGTGDAWVSIPLPIEYRIMYGMGELLTSWRTGHEKGENIGRKMLSLTGQALPLNFLEEGFDAFMPSALSPIWQIYNNESWTGLPIYKDTDFNKQDPEYTKAYKNVDRLLYNFSKAMYEWTFDEENQKARIDLNPAMMETLARGYFGGLATQLSNLGKTYEMIAGEREFDWRSIPVANRIFKSGDERTKEKRITNEYFENIEKLEFLQSRKRLLKKTKDGAAVPEEDKLRAEEDFKIMEGTDVYKKYIDFNDKKKKVDKVYRKRKEKDSKELETKYYNLMEEANREVR